MNRIVVVIALVVIAVVYQSLSLFGGSDDVDISPELREAITSAGAEEVKLTAYLQRYLTGKTIDIEAMTAQRDRMAKSVNLVLEYVEEMTGSDCKEWNNFHRNLAACFAHAAKNAEKYKEVIAYISKHNPGKETDFDAAVSPLKDLLEEGPMLASALRDSQVILMKKIRAKR